MFRGEIELDLGSAGLLFEKFLTLDKLIEKSCDVLFSRRKDPMSFPSTNGRD